MHLPGNLLKVKRSHKIFIGPGNAGTSNSGTNLKLDPENFD
jgi:hypothetical protein